MAPQAFRATRAGAAPWPLSSARLLLAIVLLALGIGAAQAKVYTVIGETTDISPLTMRGSDANNSPWAGGGGPRPRRRRAQPPHSRMYAPPFLVQSARPPL